MGLQSQFGETVKHLQGGEFLSCTSVVQGSFLGPFGAQRTQNGL